MTHRPVVARSAARALADTLPEGVAAAALEFISGALLEQPSRVGKGLRAPLTGAWVARRGQYRVIYEIDDVERTVTVLQVLHRRDAYR